MENDNKTRTSMIRKPAIFVTQKDKVINIQQHIIAKLQSYTLLAQGITIPKET